MDANKFIAGHRPVLVVGRGKPLPEYKTKEQQIECCYKQKAQTEQDADREGGYSV